MRSEIRLAGPVAIRAADGEVRHLPGAQARVVLARLTLERGGGATRDELADAVWSDRLPATWTSALRTLVSRVRAFVASGLRADRALLVVQGGRYVLRLPEGTSVDVEVAGSAIASARQALENGGLLDARRLALEGVVRLRRPFLPECDGAWVAVRREHLEELLVMGLETASDAAMALGDRQGALVLANEAVMRAPLRESAHRRRMAAHAAAGNRGEALRAYERLRRTLSEELGVGPSPETEQAYLALLSSEVSPTTLPVQVWPASSGHRTFG